jgi:hypothetical protein
MLLWNYNVGSQTHGINNTQNWSNNLMATVAPGTLEDPILPIAQQFSAITPLASPTTATLATAPTSVGGSTSGSTTTQPTAAQTSPLLASLASLVSILSNKTQATQDAYSSAINGYNATDATDQANISKSINDNEDQYTEADQAALLNAANAATGIRGTLSSIGGLAGSGLDVIRKLVGLAANSDTGSAKDTFTTNAGTIDSAAETTTQAEAQRRADAAATLATGIQNDNADVLNSKQTILQQLASLYGADDPTGQSYASQAAALAAPIAATTSDSSGTVAPYAAGSSLYTPSALTAYLAGTHNLNTSIAPVTPTPSTTGTAINSPLATSTQKKDVLTGVA